jgi:hypothetical protein
MAAPTLISDTIDHRVAASNLYLYLYLWIFLLIASLLKSY